jgi:hypothetical protein
MADSNNLLILDGGSDPKMLSTKYDSVANVHTTIHRQPPANTANVNYVTASTSSKLLLSSNEYRLGVEFYNDSNSTVYVLRGSGTANSTNYSFILNTGDYYNDIPTIYTGAYQAIWAVANGGIAASELTS